MCGGEWVLGRKCWQPGGGGQTVIDLAGWNNQFGLYSRDKAKRGVTESLGSGCT